MSADAQPRATASEERLKWLEVVTDAALAHLRVEQLLDELLARVRTLMAVDTAAVLLLDPSRQFLVATAANGIEEEVSQGVRIPIGKGFAGTIAGEKRWVSIEQVDHGNVLNPLLRQKGISSLLGVPLLTAGTVFGVLHVGTLTRRHFTEQDAALLQLVADRVASAAQSRLGQAESTAADVMRRHLLPAVLPTVDGLEFASRYVPGARGAVGGDWYDVFTLPSGTVCLVVGDVVGHGLAAALSMSEIRVALRSAALLTEDPADLLTRLDEHVTHFHPRTMATVLCAMLAPGSDTLCLSSAGHPPPVLAPSSGEAVTVDVPPDLPIGVEFGHPRRTTELHLDEGSVLCLYTDGLVERRRRVIDVNIDLLRRTVLPRAPEAVCVDVMGELVGHATPDDDIALLVVRRV
jgi:sigma-B regulation protein RsbU (phosphoserine phosphatase)